MFPEASVLTTSRCLKLLFTELQKIPSPCLELDVFLVTLGLGHHTVSHSIIRSKTLFISECKAFKYSPGKNEEMLSFSDLTIYKYVTKCNKHFCFFL